MNAEKDQLITLAHSMEVSYSALDAEAGLSYDTTVRVSVQPNRYSPDYVAVPLLWLASSHIFHGIEEFNRFRDDFEDRPEERYQQIMDSWPLVFGSTEKAMKKLFAPAKPVVKRPPWSLCPRCKKPVWAQEGTTDLRETQQLLKRNPLPRWCRVCGQRFEYTMGDHISCSSEFSIAETMDTLKSMFPTEQPNFETIAIEAAHEDGEQNG